MDQFTIKTYFEKKSVAFFQLWAEAVWLRSPTHLSYSNFLLLLFLLEYFITMIYAMYFLICPSAGEIVKCDYFK